MGADTETPAPKPATSLAVRPRMVIKAPPKDARYQSWLSSRVAALKAEGASGADALHRANAEWQDMSAGRTAEAGSALPEPGSAAQPAAQLPATTTAKPKPGVPQAVREKAQRNAIALNTVGAVLANVALQQEVVLQVSINPFATERPVNVSALAYDEDNGQLTRISSARADTLATATMAVLAELRKRPQ